MRKYIVSLVFCFLICGFNISYSVDWDKLTIPPCEIVPDTTSWQGPFTLTFCANQIPLIDCIPCCYTVVYKERWLPPNQPTGLYEVAVTGVFLSNDSTCLNCSKDDILNAFYSRLIQSKSEDTNFVNSLDLQYYAGTLIATEALLTKGTCKTNDSICDENEHCCYSYYQISYDDSANFIETKLLYDEFEPVCDTPNCTKSCRQVDYYSALDTLCYELPCNNVSWSKYTSDFISLASFGCANCSIKIEYERRQSNCIPATKDLRIKKIIYNNEYDCLTQCIDSFATYPEVYWFALDSLMKKLWGSGLTPDTCDTSLRIVHYACWGLNDASHEYEPCNINGCCWAKYSICKDSNEIITIAKLDTSNASNVCFQWSVYCQYVCNTPGLPRIGIPEEKDNLHFDFFLSNSNFDNLKLITNCSVKINFHISIYDVLGNKIFTQDNSADKGREEFDFHIEQFSTGTYFYILTTENNTFINGKFIILR